MARTVTLFLVIITAFSISAAQTTVKKPTAPAAKKTPAAAPKAAPKKTAAKKATTTKTTKTAQAPAPKPAAVETKAPETAKIETPTADTSATPGLSEYGKAKVDEAKAAKDTLVKSGSDRVTKMKEKLGDKLKNFDPFKKSAADTTKK